MTMPPGDDEGPGPVAYKEYQKQRPGEDGPRSLREQLSAIRPLVGMFALLTTSLDGSEILRLATSAMPALAPCRVRQPTRTREVPDVEKAQPRVCSTASFTPLL